MSKLEAHTTTPAFLRAMADQLERHPATDTPDGPDVIHIIIVRDLNGEPAIWTLKEYKRTDTRLTTASE